MVLFQEVAECRAALYLLCLLHT